MNINKNKALALSLLLIPSSFMVGCSNDTSYDSSQSEEKSEELTEKERDKAMKERKKLEKKYTDSVADDYSNQYEVAQRYMKEQHNIDCKFDEEKGELETGQHLSTHILDMISTDGNNTRFRVNITRMYESINSNYKSERAYDIIQPKFEEYYKHLLPEGSQINLDIYVDEENDIDFSKLEKMSFEEILKADNISFGDISIAIKDSGAEDYNTYKESILTILKDFEEIQSSDYTGNYIFLLFSKEDDFLDNYASLLELRTSNSMFHELVDIEKIASNPRYYEEDFVNKLSLLSITYFAVLNDSFETWNYYLPELEESDLNEVLTKFELKD